MVARMMLWGLVAALFAAPFAFASGGGKGGDDVFARRDDEATELVAFSDDDDDSNDGSKSGFTSGVNSNDKTGSGHSKVSRDRDRSRGDKTRDWTKDGKGGRDWSRNHTNDRSRRDTR